MIEKRKVDLRSDLDYYGASFIASDYCRFPRSLNPDRLVVWQHGWLPQHLNIHPYLLVPGNYSDDKNIVALVGRNDQRIYLQSQGYNNVKAIGAPIIYAKKLSITRKPNSLLVMPVHSLDYTTHEHWNFSQYADKIHALRNEFDEIAVCVHPSCIRKGYWVREFEELGFTVIEGADLYDRNALYRMQALLSSFEYVTTNGFGSHIAYAAYFGAKVSIFGDFAEFKEADFILDPFYTKFPEILGPTVYLFSKNVIMENFGELFVYPKDAIIRMEWGKEQLGESNKVSPANLKSILGWNLPIYLNNVAENNSLVRNVYRFAKKVYNTF